MQKYKAKMAMNSEMYEYHDVKFVIKKNIAANTGDLEKLNKKLAR